MINMKPTLKDLFKHNGAKKYTTFSLEDFVKNLSDQAGMADSIMSMASQDMVRSISTESFGTDTHAELNTLSQIYTQLATQAQQYGFGKGIEQANKSVAFSNEEFVARCADNQLTAATLATVALSDQNAYIKALRGMSKAVVSSEDFITVKHEFSGPYGAIPLDTGVALENYNEKSQRDFRVVTVGYNLEAARQDEFAERIFPTTVINPIEGGVVQVLPYIAIMKDRYHEVSGVRLENEEVNMVEAYRDPSILDNNSTDLIPAIAPDNSNAKFFIDPALVPPTTVTNEQGLSIQTAPLKPGMKLDLIGNSNANMLISKGLLDISDTIDPAGRLKNLYIKLQGKVLKFKVDRLPTAIFQPALIGDTRLAKVDFSSDDLRIDGDSTTTDAAVTAAITELKTRGWTMRLSLGFSGTISLSRGEAQFGSIGVTVDRIVDSNRMNVDLEAGAGKALMDTITDLEVVGYDLDTKFTNTNRRQRGDLIQTRALQFRHPIPMHAPITLPMSTMDEEGPGEVIKALTVNTNLRNSNNAVKRVLNYLAQLREVVGDGTDRPKFGAIEGALSAVMRPTYRYGKLHLPDVIDSMKSQDRWNDVCSAILNFVKGILFPAYRDSNIEAAFRVISGNQDERPLFIFATDKEIGNYLMTQGDDRTLGPVLKYDIVTTNNELFDGKLVVLPTRERPQENDILSWGQFFYVSTIIADLPISRTGTQVTREIAAVPFNLHVNNIPFAIEIDITGFDEVMGKSVWVKPVVDGLAADAPVTP